MTSDTIELSYLWHNDGNDEDGVKVKVSPTSVHMMSPMRKETTDIPRISSSRRYPLLKVSGYMSTTAVTKLSTHTNCRRRGDSIKTRLEWWKHSVQSRFIISVFCFFLNLHVFNRDPLFFNVETENLKVKLATWEQPPTLMSTCSDWRRVRNFKQVWDQILIGGCCKKKNKKLNFS